MIGIVITTYNRAEYTKRCLDSLRKANTSGCFILIVDDCSTEKDALDLLKSKTLGCDFILKTKKNKGVAGALRVGIDYLFSKGFPVVMNLDNDAIVASDFVDKITSLHYKFPDRVVSGFNTQSINEFGHIRHKVIKEADDYIIKKAIGGINFCFNEKVYRSFIRPALIRNRLKTQNWDSAACKIMSVRSIHPVVTKPSVIEHIGMKSTFEGRFNTDVSADFNTHSKS